MILIIVIYGQGHKLSVHRLIQVIKVGCSLKTVIIRINACTPKVCLHCLRSRSRATSERVKKGRIIWKDKIKTKYIHMYWSWYGWCYLGTYLNCGRNISNCPKNWYNTDVKLFMITYNNKIVDNFPSWRHASRCADY